MQYTYAVLLNRILKMYVILLTNVTTINLVLKVKKNGKKKKIQRFVEYIIFVYNYVLNIYLFV